MAPILILILVLLGLCTIFLLFISKDIHFIRLKLEYPGLSPEVQKAAEAEAELQSILNAILDSQRLNAEMLKYIVDYINGSGPSNRPSA